MKITASLLSTLALIAAIGVLAGCPKPAEESATPVAAAGNGEATYKTHCAGCHSGRAPNLDHVGAQRDAAWIVAHVKNPKSHNPGSSMPAFEGKIAEADLKALGDYLAAKK
jgi:mono/diheme cytochrome c family protein